jgi:shikimate kinase
LHDLLQESSLVLATGGGIVLKEENRQLLKDLADEIIYLSADVEHLVRRTDKDKKRPLLQVADPELQIRKLLNERDPLYREVATRIVTTDTRSPKIVAKEIAKSLT